MSKEEKQSVKPVKNIRVRNISISEFPKSERNSPNVVLQKFRKTKEGEYLHESIRLYDNEVQNVVKVLQEYVNSSNASDSV
jgi:hypothetical protein